MTFAQKIQQLRKDAGLSQEEFAEQLGVSRQSVSKWELAQAYPETEKIIEISQLYGVSVDCLLKDSSPLTREEAPVPAPSVRKYRIAAVLLGVLCLALATAAVFSALRLHSMESDPAVESDPSVLASAPPTDESDPPAVPAELSALRQYYFDFARQYRLDYVPFFGQGDPPTDSPEYLFFAFAINLDNWGDEKGTMTRSYVDETVLSYFGVTGLNHLSMWKGWDFDGELYTAYPDGIKDPPIYVLREYRTYQQDGLQYYEVTLDLCQTDSGERLDEADLPALRESVADGVPDGFSVVQSEVFLYRDSIQNFEKPLFLAHTLNEST